MIQLFVYFCLFIFYNYEDKISYKRIFKFLKIVVNFPLKMFIMIMNTYTTFDNDNIFEEKQHMFSFTFIILKLLLKKCIN